MCHKDIGICSLFLEWVLSRKVYCLCFSFFILQYKNPNQILVFFFFFFFFFYTKLSCILFLLSHNVIFHDHLVYPFSWQLDLYSFFNFSHFSIVSEKWFFPYKSFITPKDGWRMCLLKYHVNNKNSEFNWPKNSLNANDLGLNSGLLDHWRTQNNFFEHTTNCEEN